MPASKNYNIGDLVCYKKFRSIKHIGIIIEMDDVFIKVYWMEENVAVGKYFNSKVATLGMFEDLL